MFVHDLPKRLVHWPLAMTALAIVSAPAVTADVVMYTDRDLFEQALSDSSAVDFEGIPDGDLQVRPAGWLWGDLEAAVTMYQLDANVDGYYGAPYLSDFIAGTIFDSPVAFNLPPASNAIGGEWFHGQLPETVYDGHFTLTLTDRSIVECVLPNIATGRELSTPDFCGFISTDAEILSIEYIAIQEGIGPAVSMADNIAYGSGMPGACPADLVDSGAPCHQRVVDVFDLLELLGSWGDSGVPADLNNDGTVDVFDLLILLGAWGPCG
jgi:hypothetical protein